MRRETPSPETDPRFPSGRWTGYFLDRRVPGRHQMEVHLSFSDGRIAGEGRDFVGEFVISGRYELSGGTCQWSKTYVGRHVVAYSGFNEGKGIWGTWTVRDRGETATGGFHIWPEGESAGDGPELREAEDIPAEAELAGVP